MITELALGKKQELSENKFKMTKNKFEAYADILCLHQTI